MGRKTEPVKIGEDGGRDADKVFFITEMPASQAERWATKAFLALMRSGVDVPEDVASLGMQGIARLGFKALSGIDDKSVYELMDEMFSSCLSVVPDPANPAIRRGVGGLGPMVETDIEEVKTRFFLRMKIFELHTGFSLAGAKSNSPPAGQDQSPVSPNTQTSPARSPSLSRPVRRRLGT